MLERRGHAVTGQLAAQRLDLGPTAMKGGDLRIGEPVRQGRLKQRGVVDQGSDLGLELGQRVAPAAERGQLVH